MIHDKSMPGMHLGVLPAIAASLLVALSLSESVHGQCPQFGWSPLGLGLRKSNGSTARVYAIAQYDAGQGAAVFAGGDFDKAGLVGAAYIAKWDGFDWSSVETGLNGIVRALTVFDDGSGPVLIAAGDFTSTASGVPVSRIARWNGSEWSSLGQGIAGGHVNCLLALNEPGGAALYVGGQFGLAGGALARNVARWNGSQWSSLGPGLGNTGTHLVKTLTTYDDGTGRSLYAGGVFANGASPNIARWNGTAWIEVGTSAFDDSIDALAGCNSGPAQGLYAGGEFLHIGAENIRFLARWNGTSWSPLPTVHSQQRVQAMAVLDDGIQSTLYVGTSQDSHAYFFANSTLMRRWDGIAWNCLGIGVHGWTYAMAIVGPSNNPSVIAGGTFDSAGGQSVSNIAHWYSAILFPDHNGNRSSDQCDISSGSSSDCNLNNVPDEVESATTYSLDDGTIGASWAVADGGDYLWLNQFTVQPHGRIIDCVSLPWTPYSPDGLPVRILLYSDPNNDRDPGDAQLLCEALTQNFYTECSSLAFARVLIPPTYVGRSGDSFFVGGIVTLPYLPFSGAAAFPSSAVNYTAPKRSWRKLISGGSIDIHDLSVGPPIISVDRNWLTRALTLDCNGNGVWDQCDIDSGTSIDANADGIPDECEQVCTGDVAPLGAGNGSVNIDDLLFVLNAWGPCPPTPCAADVTNDDTVNIDDLLTVVNAWGPCP